MPAVIVVGAQLGDEGKGKITDYLSEKADVVARFNGGANAGHTLVSKGKKLITHLIPSGAMYENVVCVLGEGMVIDPEQLLKELEECRSMGFLTEQNRLLVSKGAHVVLPCHKELDEKRELGKHPLGTTKRGIGPAYESKAGRRGVRMSDLIKPDRLKELIIRNYEEIYGNNTNYFKINKVVDSYLRLGDCLAPYLSDTSLFINKSLDQDKKVLIEGAQAALLDIDHGQYPYVSSSSATAGGACASLGVGPSRISHVVGVSKPYCTQVGAGPFPTQMDEKTSAIWRDLGGEYGSTTGRPRKCGWLDIPALRRAARVNGFNSIAWTKLDVYAEARDKSTGKVCVSYRVNGRIVDEIPSDPDELSVAEPIYAHTPDTALLSKEARSNLMIRFLRNYLNVPASIVSFGADREDTVSFQNFFDR